MVRLREWVRDFLRCWALARKLQRGDLIAVRPDQFNQMLAAQVPKVVERVVERVVESPAPPAPKEPAPPPDVSDPTGRYEVFVTVPSGRRKTFLRTHDARAALREYNRHAPREGYPLTYWDHGLDCSRGSK